MLILSKTNSYIYMSYQNLIPLINKTKSPLAPEKFQERINIVFHNFESEHYDRIHKDMHNSLQEQVSLLVDDLITFKKIENKNLSLLDIGCGTGLSTEFVLASNLEPNIAKVTLLDTSINMLKQAEIKAKNWKKPYELIHGYLESVTEKYDIIIICSVLHHIPELDVFLKQVDNALNSGGILIHLQDPNLDHLNNAVYIQRKEQYKEQLDGKKKKKSISSMIPKSMLRWIKRRMNRKDYIDRINDQLIKEKTINKRMTADEIWSVTDIHVETEHEDKGISLAFLKNKLTNFDLIKMRSYCFFGSLKSELSDSYKAKESEYINDNHINGRNISCVWIKK